jgi:hypothetical protein
MKNDAPSHIRLALGGGSEKDFDSALEVAIVAISHVQPVLGIRGLLFWTETNGDVSVSRILGRDGRKQVPFARVQRDGRLIRL